MTLPAAAPSLADDELRSPAIRPLRVLEPARGQTPAVPDPAELVEREHECSALAAAVRRLADGVGGVVVLAAEAGLGKTVLLEHAAKLAVNAGSLVRRAAPAAPERRFAFGVMRALLEAPLRGASERRRSELLVGHAALAGALLLGGAIRAPDDESDTRLAHSFLWLCAALADRRPLALIVDNGHWADRRSLHVLGYLARRAEDLPLLILFGVRPGQPEAAGDLLGQLGAASGATVLHPGPLSRGGSARLIHRSAPGAPITIGGEWHDVTGGNPWLLGVLAGELAGPGPEATDSTGATPLGHAAREHVRRRVAELASGDQAVAAALTVAGDDLPARALAAMAALAPSEVGPARDRIAAAGLLTPDSRRLAHPLIASVIRADLSQTERRRLHREAARALIDIGAPAGRVADQLLQCWPEGDPDLSAALTRAAAEAMRAAAPDAAVTYLERALTEHAPGDDRPGLLARLATASFDAGHPGSTRHLRAGLDGARDDPGRIPLLTQLAALSALGGDPAGLDGLEDLERARTDTAREADRAALEAATLDALLAAPGRHAERARRAQACELTLSADPVLRRVALAHRAWLATELGSLPARQCAALALEALEGDWLLGEAWRRTAYHLCVRVLVLSDRTEDARSAIAALHDAAAARGSRPLLAAAALHASELALRTGQVSHAQAHATDALELAGPETGALSAGAISVLVRALAEGGSFAAARDLLRAHGLDGSPGRGPWTVSVLDARAQLSLAEGDFERAYQEALDVGEVARQNGRLNPALAGWQGTAALALAHQGRRPEAAALAEAELKLAEQFGASAPIARALAALAVAESDAPARIRLCKSALAGPHSDQSVLESTRLRLELGSTLARVGRRVEARDALRRALADADGAGALMLAARARRELVATGLRPRRAALEGDAALTARQRQICELAAAGTGNRAIARQLFLSIKTVETHLAAGFRKLGVSSRAELSVALAGR